MGKAKENRPGQQIRMSAGNGFDDDLRKGVPELGEVWITGPLSQGQPVERNGHRTGIEIAQMKLGMRLGCIRRRA